MKIKVLLSIGPLLPFEEFRSVLNVPWIGYRPVAGLSSGGAATLMPLDLHFVFVGVCSLDTEKKRGTTFRSSTDEIFETLNGNNKTR